VDNRSAWTGKEWWCLYMLMSLNTEDETSVWIIASEAFHCLRSTRQIGGRNVEIKTERNGKDMQEKQGKERGE
jgi:hypothetical protein